jgi:hypothetical protein
MIRNMGYGIRSLGGDCLSARRPEMRLRCLSTVAAIAMGSPSSSQAQDAATPVAEKNTCYFSKEAPLTVHLEAGQESETTFDENCNPTTIIYDIPNPEEAVGGGVENARLVPGPQPGRFGSARNSYSCVCKASSRTHDVLHISLTHSQTNMKWYWNGTNVTGRSFTSSNITADYLQDGWRINDGPWLFWYNPESPPQTPQGAEG